MSLQEAIEVLKRDEVENGDWDVDELDYALPYDVKSAIATILNAVVKGELK